MQFQRCKSRLPNIGGFSGGGFHAPVVHFNHRRMLLKYGFARGLTKTLWNFKLAAHGSTHIHIISLRVLPLKFMDVLATAVLVRTLRDLVPSFVLVCFVSKLFA